MKKSVYLSPSTQEHNAGYGNYGTEEQRMNEVADVTQRVLERYGVTVYRNKPDWSLAQVVADSNAKRPDVHFAIHSNAGGGRGCEVYCHRFGGGGEKLARAVYEELSPLTPVGDRGVKEGYNFYGPGKHMYELAYTFAPAALVEIAFHDNPDDAKWIISHIEAIGIALAKGILKYFNIPYKEDSPNLDRELKLLQEFGILESPEYWRQNAVKGRTVAGEYAAILIQRVAALLLKGGI
ncbi:N-acetylmuramoyl-L-alanine amidase family protein [Petroclostridium xylanilyticum]|jgi:N-acetylmuramoyl-L-alanine amidase|uniref:N-acetylmuramoyl-L-alanine amidase family protein n=1 Tax=Petroclostridium xylanilyticum TaxID=1792311 RepID=UPI000B98F9F8|nr:N-acetylmuramoyl-L-alanine amidase [Petroclostridium xylanilyticum]